MLRKLFRREPVKTPPPSQQSVSGSGRLLAAPVPPAPKSSAEAAAQALQAIAKRGALFS